MTRLSLIVIAALSMSLASTQAQAHLVNTRLGDFYGGMLHPLTGLSDILPWLALAVLAAFQGADRARWLVAMFPVALMIGVAAALVIPPVASIPYVSVALIAIVGLAVAAGITLPVWVLVGLGIAVALVDGYQNGQAMTPSTEHWLFVLGVTAVGYLMMTLAVALALAFLDGRGAWRRIALRASGSWIAAVGIMAFGLRLFVSGA
jgi:hydrogenase/urease accessory protein HupE